MTTTPPKMDGVDATTTPEGKPDSAPKTTQDTKTESNGGAEQTHLNGEDLVDPQLDFKGEVDTNNDIPSPKVLKAIEDYTVFDHAGKTHPFKSLYSGHNVARRVLVIFVRHFFCGNCQEYLRTLSASITPEALLGLPVSTFITVVGCGSHELIDHYVKETGCPFPVYADPTRRLYQELGMARTFAMGARPAYLGDKTVAHTVVSGIMQGLRQVKTGLVTKMGDSRQVGGEFLFEPASGLVETPISTPDGQSEAVEEKSVTWCHRMRTTRDHAEIPELMEVLGLDGNGQPTRDAKRWKKALSARKGTGLTMAGRMSVDTTKTAVAAEADA
ncbi:AhpC/TSA antioxidant enzyme-domain-containing protein [Xylaria bambusicola]|uniref:AhpC/TSA antioxidant enzyme-domain-containing protein n=1 Tax=Xylaria bambusicola TaxID=326684 RepID=UPI002008D41D|nr:AhpC/TSA antioxidant enzyme-domain-containing protein [Xylaria bambusicola]KAI0505956.1 AhpC/TSA antioxidant enzyme-domain-containing protein [Xylaria bambusicola]